MSTFTRIASVGAVVRAVRMAVRPGGPSLGERAGAVPRLVRATVAGQYQGTSVGRLVLMLARTVLVGAPFPGVQDGTELACSLAPDGFVAGE